ncbi:hypothetical protein AURDEDRAFT_129222 [Auricularia subglabra TFB-10046 SS5]|nr:hypothetical protein AURDEDRAFT_129222 [Auricularia subglabra TFB-10046 SS5]
MREWSEAHEELYHLPPEVLAACFAFLPLRDLVKASHVSRQWRTAALNNPAVWSQIHLPSGLGNTLAILSLALSRTGCSPVDLSGVAPDSYSVELPCLREHMDHIQSIHWPPCTLIPLTIPAPKLRSLVGLHRAIIVRPDSLGGKAGELRTLHLDSPYFPTQCPALSTITTLHIRCSTVPQRAETLQRLFDLCPRLESLLLGNLRQNLAHFLPEGPAPRSLSRLELQTADASYDITRHYLDWKTEALVDVVLELGGGTRPRFGRLIHNPTSLRVARDTFFERTSVVASAPGARISVGYGDTGTYASHVATELLDARERLRGVRSLELPVVALPQFTSMCTALPKLERLVILVKSENVSVPTHRFVWSALGALSSLQACCSSLASLGINAECWDKSCPPSREDARALLSQLETVEWTVSLDVNVRGFSGSDLLGLTIPVCKGFRITFVT